MAKADSTPLTTLFPHLEPELATTRRMLERVPNGKDDWRPHPKSRSLGELATHLAQLPGFALMMLTRDEFDAFASRPPAQMGVFLRMLDVPVPWPYGGSADEMPGGAM